MMQWLAFILIVASHATALAQGDPVSPANAERAREVMGKLHSAEPQTRAWGAYEAGAFHVRDAVPDLQAILDAGVPASGDREGWALLDIALDSLIQLKARVPASLLTRYARVRPVQSHILLSSATDRVPVLLGLLNDAKGLEWYAAANILLEDKAPGLAMHLLKNIRLRLTISVSEGGDRGTFGPDGMSSGVGDGIGQSPKGFPPHAAYRFERAARPGFVALVHGPRAVFYSRNVYTTFQYPVSQLHDGGPSDDDRVAYLHAMVDPFSRSSRAHTQEVASWTSPAALLEKVAEFRRLTEGRFVDLRARVEAAYRIPPDSSRVPLEVQLIDLRKDQSVPLPAVPR